MLTRMYSKLLTVSLLLVVALPPSFAATVTNGPEKQQKKSEKRLRVLVDASKDGGVWWFPQGPPDFDPQKHHQGKALAEAMRRKGWEVVELPRGKTITLDLLTDFDVVIRPPAFFPYREDEAAAYRESVASGVRLLLMGGSSRGRDRVTETFGLRFNQDSQIGSIQKWIPHPLTANLGEDDLRWTVIAEKPKDAVVLAWLDQQEPTNQPVLGYYPYGQGQVVFVGLPLIFLPSAHPLLRNILNYLSNSSPEGNQGSPTASPVEAEVPPGLPARRPATPADSATRPQPDDGEKRFDQKDVPRAKSQEPVAVRIDTSLVLVDAVVLSEKTKRVVGDLKREDFTLQENGTQQEIAHFSREELPLSVVLLLDVSASVRPIMGEVQRAAIEALGRLKPRDKVAFMVFAQGARLVAELTTDHAQIRRRMESPPHAGASTSIHQGIYEAARYLRQRTQSSERRAIVIITDDQDTVGPWPPRETVLKELYEGGTTLCGILVNAKASRLAVSAGYAEPTGGLIVNAHHRSEVARLFVEVMELLRARYTLGYYPPELPADGKLREIGLAVSALVQKQKGGVKILARRGYYPNQPLPRSQLVKADAPPSAGNQTNEPNSRKASPAGPPDEAAKPAAAEPELRLQELNTIQKATLSPSFGCQSEEERQKGNQQTALFLSELTRQRNSPDLLFNGACDRPDYFEAAIVGDDLSLIADLGPGVSLEGVAAQPAFDLPGVHAPSEDLKFARFAKVEFNHTYAVLLNKRELRGLFVFTVVGYLPNQRVDVKYVVKEYQVTNLNRPRPQNDGR